MEVVRGTSALGRTLRRPVVAIGNFDGVHLGHVALLGLARDRAGAVAGEAVVLTFDPHPAKVLAPDLAPPLILTTQRKVELLEKQGMDVCVVEPFTLELSRQAPEAFVQSVLVDGLGVAEVVVGYDFTYGRERAGTTETLEEESKRHGFAVHVVPAVTVDGLVVSSTKVREFVHEGNLPGARVLLGRELEVDGTVVEGAGRGRSIGIPTANVRVEGELLPKAGVYAGHVTVLEGPHRGGPHPAAINLGTNPTFVEEGKLSLEAHILDFTGELYGARVRVGFHSRLRGERRFPSPQELVAQIRKDIQDARHLLTG